ncbi:hypothetical protein C2G38_2161740 [Gigaspora rosea]|uniref:Uncharacterized protein n=1 Tax=Gigaspora rosea TaxID=44941 RepID=A0A397W6M4_9GLOM|nr:hypothetical protein C2G38_2161740 [Gigaspora rosea]
MHNITETEISNWITELLYNITEIRNDIAKMRNDNKISGSSKTGNKNYKNKANPKCSNKETLWKEFKLFINQKISEGRSNQSIYNEIASKTEWFNKEV